MPLHLPAHGGDFASRNQYAGRPYSDSGLIIQEIVCVPTGMYSKIHSQDKAYRNARKRFVIVYRGP